ncbi:MAG: DUF6268 family outer membrane beta-barrel protein [Vicingaceae bacterium]|nr:DUF6268 family outer membrane beta-barrel protein [Vicingaceae bacterium]
MISKQFILFLFFSFLTITPIVAQSFSVNNLFNAGATLGVDHPTLGAIDDSTDFQMTKYKFQFVKPLRTKLGVALKDFNIKKADAKASQIFLATKFSVAQPSITNAQLDNIYKGEIEFTAITASMRNGIWVYAANFYAEESNASLNQSFTPNFRAYTAYINIKNLKMVHFYGATVVINQGKIVPLPLVGFRVKFNARTKLEFIVPVHLKLNYALNRKVNFDLAGYFSGINAVSREGSVLQNDDNTVNLRELKTYLAVNTTVGKHYKLKMEAGYAFLRKLHGINTDFKQDVASAPYISFSLNYNFGHSVFGSFINGVQ